MNKCIYCKTESDKVEASGIYYCPNPECTGCGAAWFRSKLKSYKNTGVKTHTVCGQELKYAAGLYNNSREIFNKIYENKND